MRLIEGLKAGLLATVLTTCGPATGSSNPMVDHCFKAASSQLQSPDKTTLVKTEIGLSIVDLTVETQNRFGAKVQATVFCAMDPADVRINGKHNAHLISINNKDLTKDRLDRANKIARGEPVY